MLVVKSEIPVVVTSNTTKNSVYHKHFNWPSPPISDNYFKAIVTLFSYEKRDLISA